MRSFEISITMMAHPESIRAMHESIDSAQAPSTFQAQNDPIEQPSFSKATPTDPGENKNVVATGQHKSNYSHKAQTTVSYCCSVTKLSQLYPEPCSATGTTVATTATAATTAATLFEAFLAIIIVLTPIVTTAIIITTSSQAEAEDTSSTTVTTTTKTALIVEAVATAEEGASPIQLGSLSSALNRRPAQTTFVTQTGASLASPVSTTTVSDSGAEFRAGFESSAKIERLCAKVERKGEDIVDDDCADEDSSWSQSDVSASVDEDEDEDEDADADVDKKVRIREKSKEGKAERGIGIVEAKRRGDENVSKRIESERLTLDPPFFQTHDAFQTKIRARGDLLWPGERELVRSALVLATGATTATNKYLGREGAEKGKVELEERRDYKLLKLVSKSFHQTLKKASSELLLPLVLGCYVSPRKERRKEVEDRCGEEVRGKLHLRRLQWRTPVATLKETLSFSPTISKVSYHCCGSQFRTVKRNKQNESRITQTTAVNNITGKGDRSRVREGAKEELEERREELERREGEERGLNIEGSANKFKRLPAETSLIGQLVLVKRKNNENEKNENGLRTNNRDNKQSGGCFTNAPNIRIKRHAKLYQADLPISIINKETTRPLGNQFQVQQQATAVTTTTLLATPASNSIRFNPFDQADQDRVNEDLVELLAQFYAHTQELQDKLEHYLYLSKFQRHNKGEELIKFENDNSSIADSNNQTNKSQVNNLGEASNFITNQDRNLIKIIKMKIGADDDSLLRWLRQKQEKFSSLKNATFELLNEPPNKTINVCQDGPKILVLPNVSDLFYCYTSEQWVDKLWSDLRLSAFHYPIIVLNILIFLFGTTGNIFVCLSVYKNHQLRNVTNYFIVNLAFADFLVILICLPATVVWDLSLTWFFGTIPCKLIMFLQDVSISVSVLTLTAISIDRYYAVCYPLKFKSSLNQAKRIIVLIWIVSLILMAPDLVYLSAKYSQELSEAGLDTVLYSDCNYDWSERSSRIFQFVKTILLYLLPFILMLCAHYRIMLTLRAASQSAHNELAATMKDGIDGEEFHQLEPTTNEGLKIAASLPERKGINEGNNDDTGERAEQPKMDVAGAQIKADTQFHSLAIVGIIIGASPPTPLLKQIRFYQTHSSNIDMFHATNNSQQSSTKDSRYNMKVESNSRINSSGCYFQKIISRLSCRKTSRSPSMAASANSSLTTYLNQARGSVASYQINLSRDEIVPSIKNSSSSSNRNKQSQKASTANNQSSQLLVTMHNKNKLDSRKAAAKMLMTIVVMFGICYLPVHLINFLRQFIDNIPQTDVTSTISMLSHCACYLNSAINPIIYNHMNSIFRAEFKKFLSCLYCWKKPGAKIINKMAQENNNSSFKPTNNEPGGIKLKQLNVTSQRRSPGLVHQIAISDNEEIHLTDRDNNQADNGEQTRMTDIF